MPSRNTHKFMRDALFTPSTQLVFTRSFHGENRQAWRAFDVDAARMSTAAATAALSTRMCGIKPLTADEVLNSQACDMQAGISPWHECCCLSLSLQQVCHPSYCQELA